MADSPDLTVSANDAAVGAGAPPSDSSGSGQNAEVNSIPSDGSNAGQQEETTTIEFSSLSAYDDVESSNQDEDNNTNSNNKSADMIVIKRAEQMDKNLALVASSGQLSPINNGSVCASPGKRNRLGSNTSYAADQFTISWHNLDYVVESKWYKLASQRKPILNALSGSFKSGELSAVLGPSGAGKSTLIDCLMGKHTSGLSGKTKVTFADPIREAERRRKRPLKIATIPQEDHLLDTLTVMETFMFASRIKNAHLTYQDEDPQFELDEEEEIDADLMKETGGKKVAVKRKPFNHFTNVQRVIQQLHLSSCASLKCGKLSGGQYKRVSIGQELLSRPDLLILDEPTSGLDSVTCYQTISALRQLIETSAYPMSIVATIHQPDVEVFDLFHKCYVLASGGRSIYEGPTEGIFDTVKLGVELVEARRKRAAWQVASSLDAADKKVSLMSQLDERKCNPARLIVELAANEYGFEITNALNDIQRSKHQDSSPFSSRTDISASGLDATSTSETSGHGSTISMVEFNNKCANISTCPSVNLEPGVPNFDYEAFSPAQRKPDLDKLLNMVSANMSQRRSLRVYLRHLSSHTKRSWLTIVRDPMLFSVQVALHVLVPLLVSYSFQGHRSDACPQVGTLDVVNEAYRSGSILEDLNGELRVAFENMGYMFFQIYVIIFAAVCVTSLTYPLAMHVLLKEYRNGWYSMSSYFLGRTLADLPVPTFNVYLAMAISYHLTGQPLSPYGWRFMSVASITVLATLVAQTQGLMFGALLMNAPQAAVFVAPASTAPLVVVSGFLIRIRSLPVPLQILSKLSYFTHLLNGFVVGRYGFNRCACNEQDFITDESHLMPQQARTLIDIWIDTFQQEYRANNTSNAAAANNGTVDLVGKLVSTITRAKMFGKELTDCSQVKPFTMIDYELEDIDLFISFAVLIGMFVAFRIGTYMVLTWKIGSAI